MKKNVIFIGLILLGFKVDSIVSRQAPPKKTDTASSGWFADLLNSINSTVNSAVSSTVNGLNAMSTTINNTTDSINSVAALPNSSYAPQIAQDTADVPSLITELSTLSVKTQAQILGGVGNKVRLMPQPKVPLLQKFTVGPVLSGLYKAIDTLEAVIDQIKSNNLIQTVPTLDRYLMTRLLTIAGKLG